MSKIIGIDLGTTNSLAAVVINNRPQIICNAEGSNLTPSVVSFNNGQPLVGQLAKRQAAANPEKTIFSVKRQMGGNIAHQDLVVSSIKRYMGSDVQVDVNGHKYSPVEISALILKKVKNDVEKALGETVKKAVVTVPAYFNDSQRRATHQAAILAGLDVSRILNEPTAAALAYGLDREEVHTILIWDLGGGTFDVSILELGSGVFDVRAVNGNTHLGGDDWDQRLVDFLVADIKEKLDYDPTLHKTMMQRLREAAQIAKEELSLKESTLIRIPFIPVGHKREKPYEATLSRDFFEAMTGDLREKLVGPTNQALADANLKTGNIDRVVLVGGASKMPAVKSLVSEITGKRPYCGVNPDEVVALGAAIQAGILMGEVKNMILVDVTPLSLGIETKGGLFAKIIQRNTPIPTSKGKIFTTAVDNQSEVDIHVLQGERELAADNITLEHFQLCDLPPLPRGVPKIEVTFGIDESGIVDVAAQDLNTNQAKEVKISSAYKEYTGDDFHRAIKQAENCAEIDRKKRFGIEAQIRADSMIAAAECLINEAKKSYLMSDAGSSGQIDEETSISRGLKKDIRRSSDFLEKEILAVKRAMAKNEVKGIESATENLRLKIEKFNQFLRKLTKENAPSP